MKCEGEVSSDTVHDVMISTEIKAPRSYKDICRGESRKVNVGYINDQYSLKVENNSMTPWPRKKFIFGQRSEMSHEWEILSSFFSIQSIVPRWLDCHFNPGLYDEEQGRWTGCMGKVGDINI